MFRCWSEAPLIDNLEDLFELLLAERNLHRQPHVLQSFLSPQIEDLHDSFLMHGMDESVERIQKAIADKERIMVYGDFDADGITSTVILVDGLTQLGAEVSYRIPDRNVDSHGLKSHILENIAEQNVQLMITCDCGINEKEQVAYATQLGIEVIITDHHTPVADKFPDQALAVINPKLPHCPYPEKHLSGSGIAFKVITALLEKSSLPKAKKASLIQKYLEPCAIGLIADCMKLTGENRLLAKLGLKQLQNTSWPGLAELFRQTNIEPSRIDEETVGFSIAPRLNAASRLGNVNSGVQLFLGKPEFHSQRIEELELLNQVRKSLTEKSTQQAREQIKAEAPFQFFFSEDWKNGLLGLIAGRLCEELHVPIVAATVDEGGIMNASARCPKGLSIIEALTSCQELLEQFGGHESAAGFKTDEKHREAIHLHLNKFFEQKKPPPRTKEITAYVADDIIGHELVDFLASLAPFGPGNPPPVFGLKNVLVEDFQIMGQQENHLKITGKTSQKNFQILSFFANDLIKTIAKNQMLDVLFSPTLNYWNQEAQLQLRLIDCRLSD